MYSSDIIYEPKSRYSPTLRDLFLEKYQTIKKQPLKISPTTFS